MKHIVNVFQTLVIIILLCITGVMADEKSIDKSNIRNTETTQKIITPLNLFEDDNKEEMNSDVLFENILKSNDSRSGLFKQPPANYPVGNGPRSVFATDLDNDSDNDLAIPNYNSNNLSILFSQSANLVAHWSFDNIYGDSIPDISGNDNYGTNFGAGLTTDRFGNPNSAVIFDGENDYINCGNSTTLDITGDEFSLCAWFKTSTSEDYGTIVTKGPAGGSDTLHYSYLLRLNHNQPHGVGGYIL